MSFRIRSGPALAIVFLIGCLAMAQSGCVNLVGNRIVKVIGTWCESYVVPQESDEPAPELSFTVTPLEELLPKLKELQTDSSFFDWDKVAADLKRDQSPFLDLSQEIATWPEDLDAVIVDHVPSKPTPIEMGESWMGVIVAPSPSPFYEDEDRNNLKETIYAVPLEK